MSERQLGAPPACGGANETALVTPSAYCALPEGAAS